MDTKTNEGFKSHGLKSILYGTLIFVLILSLSGGGVNAATVTNSPGTAVNDSSNGGTLNWTNPTNVYTNDGNRATATITSGTVTTGYLKATNFGFSIPAGARIDGIEVTVERSRDRGGSGGTRTVTDSRVRIVNSTGGIGTTDKANTGTTWPSNDGDVTYGSPTDLWDLNWTPADINDPDFGMVIAATITCTGASGSPYVTARIDYISIKVYYAICGNNVTESGETCDGNYQLCTVGGSPGTQSCNTTCSGWNTCTKLCNVTLLDDGFEGSPWDSNWWISEDWAQNSVNHSGNYSARANENKNGDLSNNGLNTSDAIIINVSFWYMLDNTENSYDFGLYYYDSNWWWYYDFIADLGGGTEDTWLHYTDTITDSQYFLPDFRIYFDTDLESDEHVWVDDVLITKFIMCSCTPETEVCDGIDNDCDGDVDENLTLSCGVDNCSGNQTCTAGVWSNCSTEGNDCGVCALCNASGYCSAYDDTQDSDCTATTCPGDVCGGNGCGLFIWCDYPASVPNECTGLFTCSAYSCDSYATCGPDNDSDNYSSQCGDCNDNNASIHPGATELCNGVDDDCDGYTDENACARIMKNDSVTLLVNSITRIRMVDTYLSYAIASIKLSLEPSLWIDDAHINPVTGGAVFDKEKKAVEWLMSIKLYRQTPANVKAVCDTVIGNLTGADESIAQIAIDEAIAANPSWDPANANADMATAQTKITEGKYNEAINYYKQAWQHAKSLT